MPERQSSKSFHWRRHVSANSIWLLSRSSVRLFGAYPAFTSFAGGIHIGIFLPPTRSRSFSPGAYSGCSSGSAPLATSAPVLLSFVIFVLQREVDHRATFGVTLRQSP